MKRELQEYLYGTRTTGLLLLGKKGMNMIGDATQVASSLLESPVDDLMFNPDYMSLGLSEGASSLGVAEAEMILDRASLKPTCSEKIVIIIDDFNKMTIPAQNKLLKLLEESETSLVIGIAYEDTILPTIKSRLMCVRYEPLTIDSYISEGIGSEEDYFVSGGLCAISPEQESVKSYFEGVKKSIEEESYADILKVLHLVKEKDNQEFFTKNKEYVSGMVAFLGYLFTKKLTSEGTLQLFEVISLCGTNRERCTDISYTKNDFYAFVSEVVTLLIRKEGFSNEPI